jgi:hypothetical protein
MSDPSMILGEWTMRRGDRLPLLSVVIEDDEGNPANLTGGTAFLQLRCEDGEAAVELPDSFPPVTYVNGWLVLQAYVYNAVAGVVVYDWPDAQTAGLAVGVDEMVVAVHFPDGSMLTAPTNRDARLIVRPAILPPSF